MIDILRDLADLYATALKDTGRSLQRGWIGFVAVPLYGIVLTLVTPMVMPLGITGGFILGFVNAVAAGALLALVEQCLLARRLSFGDLRDALGHYWWEVIGIGFVLMLPSFVLQQIGANASFGPFAVVAVYILAAVFLNPLPEIVYQVKGANPVEHLGESVRFIHQHWIEWFLPAAIVVAPILLAAERSLISGASGLDFGFETLLAVPLMVATSVTKLLGVTHPLVSVLLAVVLTSVITFAMLVFRGHLFAALRGSTRRARAFRRRMSG